MLRGLAFTTLNYFCTNHGDQRVFQFEINDLVSSFRSIEYLC